MDRAIAIAGSLLEDDEVDPKEYALANLKDQSTTLVPGSTDRENTVYDYWVMRVRDGAFIGRLIWYRSSRRRRTGQPGVWRAIVRKQDAYNNPISGGQPEEQWKPRMRAFDTKEKAQAYVEREAQKP